MLIKLGIASDHAGYELKEFIKNNFEEYKILDFGTHDSISVDYPDYADKVTDAIRLDEIKKGILICGSGIGISIAANRNCHVRAALCLNDEMALLSRKHNDANILVLGAKFVTGNQALNMLKIFINTEFEAGRHQRRLDKISEAK